MPASRRAHRHDFVFIHAVIVRKMPHRLNRALRVGKRQRKSVRRDAVFDDDGENPLFV